ncbi:MAG: glutathione S-transferase [Sphingomonadales bacterium]|nr:glutathione S-transferase [Sphingomonadales bacterium]
MTNDDAVTMTTFAPTLDSEQARLMLRYYGIRYRERDHLMPFVLLPAFLYGGGPDLPLIHGRGVKVAKPRPIAEHYDAGVPEPFRLIPAEPELARQFEADWQLYNGTMSAGTAIFAYYHLLPEQELMAPIFAEPTSWPERAIMPVFYPVMRSLIASRLKLSPEAAEVAHGQILSSFAETDRRVADGRLYLNGERMTLGDIALAAAAAPLLLPEGFGTRMPTLEQTPPPMRTLMTELAARPTAAFVRRFYAEGLPAARAKLAAAKS